METFLDGGLFELLIAIGFAYFLNFIYLKKFLLIIFSALVIAAPISLFFIKKNEFYFWLVAMCLFNAVLLIVLLWKEKKRNPGETLFNVEGMKNKLAEIKSKISNIFSKSTDSVNKP
jgi:Ca2+/Na+ antiporter